MTLVLVMRNEDSITLVSDGLSRMFDPDTYTEDSPLVDTRKIIPLGQYLAMGYSNSGLSYEYVQGMLFYVKECLLAEKCLTVLEATCAVNTLLQRYIASNPMPTPSSFRILVAGFDKDSEGNPTKPEIFVLNQVGEMGQANGSYLAIGADQIACPIFDKLSGGKDLSLIEALHIGAETLFETASQNDYVGGKFMHRTITRNEGISKPIDLLTYNRGMSKKLFKKLIKRASQPAPKEPGK